MTSTPTAVSANSLDKTSMFFRLMGNAAKRLRFGSAMFILPDGRKLCYRSGNQDEECAVVIVKDFAFARRTILGGTIGFYESFADDQWDTPDLAKTLYVFASNADEIQKIFMGNPVFRVANKVAHSLNRNTKSGSKKNIMAHYDLGNAFYEKWLDPSMTYSSALFERQDQSLEEAQGSKYRHLARQMDLQPGEKVLEIGSGWGGFAEVAAKEFDARVTGVTISKEQLDYAQERMFREGLNEKVEIRFQDYRDVEGEYDKIASIEMFEAVGKEYWPAYFGKVRDTLKPGGRAGLQIISIADRYFEAYDNSSDFIQRHVFPGGMLPSLSILKDQIDRAGLKLAETKSFGLDYADTLHRWHEAFLAAWDDLVPLGFDDKFKKLWRFYLAYCEAGFRARSTDVGQYALVRV